MSFEDWRSSTHQGRRAFGACVNQAGYPPGTVNSATAWEDIPEGYRMATLEEEIEVLFRLHRDDVAGYAPAAAMVTAVRTVLERRGGTWPS